MPVNDLIKKDQTDRLRVPSVPVVQAPSAALRRQAKLDLLATVTPRWNLKSRRSAGIGANSYDQL